MDLSLEESLESQSKNELILEKQESRTIEGKLHHLYEVGEGDLAFKKKLDESRKNYGENLKIVPFLNIPENDQVDKIRQAITRIISAASIPEDEHEVERSLSNIQTFSNVCASEEVSGEKTRRVNTPSILLGNSGRYKHEAESGKMSTPSTSPVNTPNHENDFKMNHASTHTFSPTFSPNSKKVKEIRNMSTQTVLPSSLEEHENEVERKNASTQTTLPTSSIEDDNEVEMRDASTQTILLMSSVEVDNKVKMRNASTQTILPMSYTEDDNEVEMRDSSTQTTLPTSSVEDDNEVEMRNASTQTILPTSSVVEDNVVELRNASTQTVLPASSPKDDEPEVEMRHASTQTSTFGFTLKDQNEVERSSSSSQINLPTSFTKEKADRMEIINSSTEKFLPVNTSQGEFDTNTRHLSILNTLPVNTLEDDQENKDVSPVITSEDDNRRHGNTQSNEKGVSQQVFFSQQFVRTVWTAFLACHAFAIPAIFGMILSVISRFEYPENDGPYQDIVNCMIMGFIGISVLVGLPIHMFSMDDLEAAVNSMLWSEEITSSKRDKRISTESNNNYEDSVGFESDDSDDDIQPYF